MFYRLLLNIFFALLLLISIIVYYMGIGNAGIFGVLSLMVPILVFVNIVFMIDWGIRKNPRFLLSFITLTISYFVFGSFFKLFGNNQSGISDLKILTYNTRSFNNNEAIKEPDIDKKIIKFVNDLDPDIICFQEFYHIKQYDGNFKKYPYRFVDFNEEKPKGKIIQAIFSKHPILNEKVFEFKKSGNSAIAANILINQDTITVYNVHFESFGIVPNSEVLKNENSGRTLRKIARTFIKQQEQSLQISNDINLNTYQSVLCGDLNNTQFSSVYREVIGNFQDSFLETGHGFGKTFSLKGFPMRIDYILADDSFEFTSHTNYEVEYSDHFPVMATLKMKSDKATVD